MSRRLLKNILRRCGGAYAGRRLTRYRPRILMYHGLTQDRAVGDWTQVHVEDFADQMGYIRSVCRPVSLDELVSSLETGDIPPHAVAVTFDDGYKSNFELALPILREFRIPATVFVTSGFISRDDAPLTYLWPDMVTMILLSMPEDELDLSRFEAGKYVLSTMPERHAARNRLMEHLKSLPDRSKNEIVDWLKEAYSRHIAYEKFSHLRPLSLDELRRLADDDLITIGAHSRTHPILSRLKGDDLHAEIVGSKEDIQRMTGREVDHFAYPNGRRQDIGPAALEIAAGHFRSAVTTEAGLSRRGMNKYLLPRIGVGRTMGMPEFKMQVAGIYYMARKTAADL
jgi:peptidoglycan/xylan/chitin deacetylase (PgdA/CDA1 family)